MSLYKLYCQTSVQREMFKGKCSKGNVQRGSDQCMFLRLSGLSSGYDCVNADKYYHRTDEPEVLTTTLFAYYSGFN